ncbi:hypothetical protein [Rubrivirga sp. IMCC43871]|uniref:hypothetical protein n=1 Tax=Rubrivirga sp. IMCC43871 TaxID=3391575 RepID=UPI00398F97DF
MRIACPSCAWEPTADARWSCMCGHAWNTFETGGQCPACGRVWRETQCLACAQWAKHHDWYHDLPPIDALLGKTEAEG